MTGEREYTTATIVFKDDDVEVSMTDGCAGVNPQRLHIAGRKLQKLFLERRSKVLMESRRMEEENTHEAVERRASPEAAEAAKDLNKAVEDAGGKDSQTDEQIKQAAIKAALDKLQNAGKK